MVWCGWVWLDLVWYGLLWFGICVKLNYQVTLLTLVGGWGYPNIYFYHFSSRWTYLNAHTKLHTRMKIPDHKFPPSMIINEDETAKMDGRQDRQTHRITYTGGAHLKIT